MIAGGVFHFFEESQVKQVFSMLADNFHGGEIVFNVLSRLGDGFGGWMDIISPEQGNEMRTALTAAIKDWWKKAPKGQKEKLNDVIASLELLKKPKGKRWSDLEAWWNQLSDKEIVEVMRGFRKSFRAGAGTWELQDARELTKWDNRITVLDQFPMFKKHPTRFVGRRHAALYGLQ